MPTLLELLKQRNSLYYNPYVNNQQQGQPIQEEMTQQKPIESQQNINPEIYQQYLKDMQEPEKPKGFFANIKSAINKNPSLLPSLIGGITALTKGNPYLAGAMGEAGNRMQQQEQSNSAQVESEKRSRRADYVKGAVAQQGNLQEAIAKAQQAYELKGLELGQKEREKEEQRAYETQKQEKDFAFKQAQLDKELAFKEKKQNQDLNMESKKIANSIKKTNQGKILPASQATEIGDVVSSVDMLDNLAGKIGDIKGLTYSPADNAKALNPWDTGAQNFKQLVASTKQVIGKGLEGGVLRKEDEDKYNKIIPKIGDTKEVLQVKYNNLRDLLLNKHKNLTTSLKQAGYNVVGLQKDFEGAKTIKSTEKNKVGRFKIVGVK